ncbi:MAG TPA: PSD1 and planctomycete cytochrome C domain-containing protein, partial [Gemmataceae bacterium]|nr:PSD1 and planctomycete cytochrome C domain-containing protein [Gemmataceae bacterium]
LVMLLTTAAPITRAQSALGNGGDFFEKEVWPLLVARCHQCHGDLAKPKGKLHLTSRANVLQGGESGPAVVPGKPTESLLIQAIGYTEALKMPPKEKLPDGEVAILTRWVKMGLPWPESRLETAKNSSGSEEYQISSEQRAFWSFQPVKDHLPPKVKDESLVKTAVDRFVLAELEKKELRPAPAADKRTLIRRATFDLIGLPPTPQEIEAFVNDSSPQAFAKVIDRLLASPHYGERWGRHWLDLVRYTDSFDARILNGPGSVMDITESWRYRDWVVGAFNRDLPYDQFIAEQLAGDILASRNPGPESNEQVIATGMLAIGNWGGGDADKEKLLTDIVDDQIDVVGRTIMGLTLGCARCHDHKFDPIPTADYYSLAGIFFSTHILPNVGPKTDGPPMLRIPLGTPEEISRRARFQEQIAEAERRLQSLTKNVYPDIALRLLPEGTRWPAVMALVKRRAEMERTLTELKKKAPSPLPFANGAQEGGVPESPHAGVHDVRVHIRGNYARLGETTPRRFPRIVAGDRQTPIHEGSGRLPLARWLTSPNHPLTARVMVNRIWQHHFGEGIVRSPSNFGKQGDCPTHPELLDYLAKRFVESGWSIKAMHRLMMLSAAYQQSSETSAETLQADPDNRLFGRMNRRRLESVDIRDNLLALAGQMNSAMGGKATRDFHNPRRTLYQMTIRSDRSGFGPLFDIADSDAPEATRTVSTVAPQALFLLNHPFIMEQKSALARRILEITGASIKERMDRAYLLLYGRPPSDEESQIGIDFLARAGSDSDKWQAYCEILLCANEFIYVD